MSTHQVHVIGFTHATYAHRDRLDRRKPNGGINEPTPTLPELISEIFVNGPPSGEISEAVRASLEAGVSVKGNLTHIMGEQGYRVGFWYDANRNPHLHALVSRDLANQCHSYLTRKFTEDGLVPWREAYLTHRFTASGKPVPGAYTLYVPPEFGADEIKEYSAHIHKKAKNSLRQAT